MMSAMTLAGDPAARGAHVTRCLRCSEIQATCKGAWNVRWGRFFSDYVDRRKTIPIEATATGLEQCWWRVRRVDDFAETLTGAWMVRWGSFWRRCVEGLKDYTMIFLMSQSELRGDRSYGGSGFGGGGEASGGRDSTQGHWKGLLTTEVETVENTNKTRLQDIRKLEQWLWYHVRNTE